MLGGAGCDPHGQVDKRALSDRYSVAVGTTARLFCFLVAAVAVGCGSHHPNVVNRAEYRYWMQGNHAQDSRGASCVQHGHAITDNGHTYTAYVCTIHGGRQDGATFAAYWNGTSPLSCSQLPREASNALCFD